MFQGRQAVCRPCTKWGAQLGLDQPGGFVKVQQGLRTQQNFYFVAFVLIKENPMDTTKVTFHYAPLRRFGRKLGRWLYYAIPEALVIAAAVWTLLTLVDHFFF